MALNPIAAQQDLQTFCDPNYSGYLGNAPDNDTAIARAITGWGDAIFHCAQFITPSSSSALSAKAAFLAAAEGMYISGAVFQAACAAFAHELGLGMSGDVDDPPGLFVPSSISQNHAQACLDMANGLAAWFATGKTDDVNWS